MSICATNSHLVTGSHFVHEMCTTKTATYVKITTISINSSPSPFTSFQGGEHLSRGSSAPPPPPPPLPPPRRNTVYLYLELPVASRRDAERQLAPPTLIEGVAGGESLAERTYYLTAGGQERFKITQEMKVTVVLTCTYE